MLDSDSKPLEPKSKALDSDSNIGLLAFMLGFAGGMVASLLLWLIWTALGIFP